MLVPRSAAGRAALSLCLFAAAAVVVSLSIAGCDMWSRGEEVTEKKTAPAEKTAEAPRRVEPLFEGWERPAATLVLTGEQHGYIEPCGCSETQSGGLARRHDLFKQLEKRGWPAAGLDLGGMVGRNRKQTEKKFESMLEGLQAMNYQVLGLGSEELRFGVDYLLSRREFDPTSQTIPSIVDANITLFDSPDLGPRRFKIIQVGDVKIGITAVLGQGIAEKAIPQGSNNQVVVGDPAAALAPVLEKMKAEKPTLLVLLSHTDLEESRKLAEQYPDFQLIVSAGGPEDPQGEPITAGKTMIVQVGHKGKYAGVVGYYPQSADTPLRFELVNLDKDRFQNSPEMNELMRRYQQKLEEFAREIMADLPASVHPRNARFVGADKCGECHTKAFAKWKTTPHARAYESLITGRKGQEATWVPRNHDPECLACHVTGWDPQEILRYDSGFQLEALAQDDPGLYTKLKGQQCENCHGPGSRHVELEELWKRDRSKVSNDEVVAARAEMKLNKATAAQQVCHKCHDPDNSPHFEFDRYWKDVEHPWRD